MRRVNKGIVIKMMGRGIFEGVGSLPIVSISGINFAYNTNMEGYTTLSLDIPKLKVKT